MIRNRQVSHEELPGCAPGSDFSSLLLLAVEQSSDGIAITDLEGNVLYLNKAFSSMHGYEPDEIFGKNLAIFHRDDQLESVRRANEQILQEGKFVGEIWHMRRDGSVFPTIMINSVLKNESGDPIGMMGTVRDISSEKRAQEALAASEMNYRTIFNAANDAFFIHDFTTGAIIDVNECMCEMFGFTREEALHLHVGDISSDEPPYTQADAFQKITAAVQEGPQRFRWQSKDRSGRVFWSEVNLKYVHIGEDERVLAVVRDISEQVAAEEKIQAYSGNLEQLVQERTRELDLVRADLFTSAKLAAMGRLGAGIAHQLNSPLCGARLILDALLEDCREHSQSSKRLQDLHVTLDKMQEIINTMLSLASITRKGSLQEGPIRINEILQGIAGLCHLECKRRNISITSDYASELPNIPARQGELDQVFLNLLNNAIDAVEDGGNITIATRLAADCIEVHIRDQGKGIPEDKLHHIFEPFFTTKREKQGLGLGLSIAREIVERYGGTINVQSTLGEGTTFLCAFPVHDRFAHCGVEHEENSGR